MNCISTTGSLAMESVEFHAPSNPPNSLVCHTTDACDMDILIICTRCKFTQKPCVANCVEYAHAHVVWHALW